MGTYYHGNSEIQGDGLQTLILMNPGYNNNNNNNVGYSDTPQQQQQPPPTGNYMFLNPNSTGGNSLNHSSMSHAPPAQQFVGIPLSATASAAPQQDINHPHHSSIVHSQHDMSGIHGYMPRLQYSLYNPVDLTAARDVTRTHQGLSLSLSSQQHGYGSFGTDREMSSPALTPGHPPTISPRSGGGGGGGGDDVRAHGGSSSSVSGVSNGVNGMQSVLLSSKYLKAAQELLDEVVNVGKGVKASVQLPTIPNNGNMKNGESSPGATGDGSSGGGGEGSSKRVVELTTAERQEIQLKKAKLVNMLDEVLLIADLCMF